MNRYYCVIQYKKGLFKKMQNEYNRNGQKVKIFESKEDISHVKNGDFVYVIVKNLPDDSSRLFFKTKVCRVENNSIIVHYIRGISYGNYDKYLLKNNMKENVLYKDFPNDWDFDIIDKEFDNAKEYYRIGNLDDYYYDFKCEICGKTKTFKNLNNVEYAEFHHFIPRSINNNAKNKIRNINDRDNYIMLCPKCHSEIHHAPFERRMELIKSIYSKVKVRPFFIDLSKYLDTNKLVNIKNEDEIIEWIFKLYLNEREKVFYNKVSN